MICRRDDICRSPLACLAFGYCRVRNADGLPQPETAKRWSQLDNPPPRRKGVA